MDVQERRWQLLKKGWIGVGVAWVSVIATWLSVAYGTGALVPVCIPLTVGGIIWAVVFMGKIKGVK